MAPRRPHNKSRHGCLTCKRRRVKCDENGPPCTNCKYRQTPCEYANPAWRQVPSEIGSSASSTSPIVPKPDQIFCRFTALSPDRRRINELQLLHRWSTVTYDSMATRALGDWEIWQKIVPGKALKHDFLLNIIFALSAFDMAFSRPGDDATQYLGMALEYQGLAFRGFRNHLQTLVDRRTAIKGLPNVEEDERKSEVVTCLAKFLRTDESKIKRKNVLTLGMELSSEEHDTMLYASLLMMALALASATAKSPSRSSTVAHVEGESMIQQAIAHHDLSRSIQIVLLSKPDCITTHELFRHYPQVRKAVKMPLEDKLEWIMTTLSILNEDRMATKRGPLSRAAQASLMDPTAEGHTNGDRPDGLERESGGEDYVFDDLKELADSLDEEPELTPHYSACKNALMFLRYMFETRFDEHARHLCLAWLNMAGNEYIQAVKDRDRTALLMLASWAVLMQMLGDILWYVKDFGKLLVREVREILKNDHDARVWEVLDWAAKKVDNSGNINHIRLDLIATADYT